MKQMAKRSRREMSGFLDFLFPKREGPKRSIFGFAAPGQEQPETQPLPGLPAPRSGAMIPRPEQAPIPVKPSMFEFAAPKAPAEPPPRRPDFFTGVGPPSPPAPPPATPAEQAAQTSLWNDMFEQDVERPVAAFFGQARQEERPARWVPVSVYKQTLPWQSIWPFPTIEQLISTLRRNLDLNSIFRELQATRETLEFWRDLQENSKHGQPIVLRVAPVVYQELYTDLARFFGVPPTVFEYYVGSARTAEEERQAFDRLWNEVISPLTFAMQEAFETITPANLPGWFTILVDERTGEYFLYYVEAYVSPPPPPDFPFQGGGPRG